MREAVARTRFIRRISLSAVALVAGLAVHVAHAQATSADTFDIERFSEAGKGWFETFYVSETHLLRDVLSAGTVSDDTKVLVTETADGPLALITDQMAFHHIAEGTVGGKDWMATF